MTRNSIREYAQAIRQRYRKASKEEKGKILDEFTKTTGLHRKAAIRMLNRSSPSPGKKRRGTAAEVWQCGCKGVKNRLGDIRPPLLQASVSFYT